MDPFTNPLVHSCPHFRQPGERYIWLPYTQWLERYQLRWRDKYSAIWVLSASLLSIFLDCLLHVRHGQTVKSHVWIQLHEHGTTSQIARIMRPTCGPPGAGRTQVGPMLATWTLLSGLLAMFHACAEAFLPPIVIFPCTTRQWIQPILK